jgi:anaerobic magnesium-protoporphyrin IX monomethyl ester cyclase
MANTKVNTKVLLLEAPYSYGSGGNKLVKKYFPLGIGYLASYLRQAGYQVKIFESLSDNFSFNDLDRQIESFKPNLLGISVMTPSYPRAVEICEQVKSEYNIKTVLGGHHVSAVKEDVLRQSQDVDFAVIGEGERTLLELVNQLDSTHPEFDRVNGLAWRDGDKIIINRPRELIRDIDILPFPARDMVDISKYGLHSYIDFGKKSATMITSRGCPFDCIFCSSQLTMGRGYRFRSTKNIVAEIRELGEKHEIDHIVFEDDTMTLRRDRMEEICHELIAMPNSPSWNCLSRVDTLDYPLAKLMKQAGCRMVGFGVESGSEEILELIGKKISVENAIKAVESCQKAGLRTQCTFIVGFPFDTKETMQSTLEAAKKINPTIAMFFPLTPYPGTRVYNDFLDTSQIPSDINDWKKFIMTDGNFDISVNKDWNSKQIKKLSKQFYKSFYLRPKHWLRMLSTVSNLTDIVRLGKGGIYLLISSLKK